MKITITSASILALGLLPAASANSCTYRWWTGGSPDHNGPTSIEYDIWAENVVDIAGKCGGLWANLGRFGDCASPSRTYCGGIEDTHILNWKFHATIGCNTGMIESTWWEATRNQFGSIHCTEA